MRSNKIATSETAKFADRIYKSGNNLLEIIEDILSLALADGSCIKLREECFKGLDLFTEQKTLLKELLVLSTKEKNIHLVFTPSSNILDNHFIADKNKINQVVVNLLKNAIKFTESGTIEYLVGLKRKKIIFEIKDSGIGIPKHQQNLIFDFFRQADGSNTRSYSGIGVGLSISKRISEILGGKLSVSSNPGEGSTFTFEVPVKLVSSQPSNNGYCHSDVRKNPYKRATFNRSFTTFRMTNQG